MTVIQCVIWDKERLAVIRGGAILRHELENLLGLPLHIWFARIFSETCRCTGKPLDSLDGILVRVLRIESPKGGVAFKDYFRNGKILKGCPHMHVGYAGDLQDFKVTAVHEALHLLNYDEEVTEAKAISIVERLKSL